MKSKSKPTITLASKREQWKIIAMMLTDDWRVADVAAGYLLSLCQDRDGVTYQDEAELGAMVGSIDSRLDESDQFLADIIGVIEFIGLPTNWRYIVPS